MEHPALSQGSFQFCDVAEGHHPWDDLARFGYVLGMKVKKPKSFYILGYLLEVIIKICKIWVIFFHEISFA
jgi:hypothetical protein